MATGRYGQVIRTFISRDHFAGMRNIFRRAAPRPHANEATLAEALRDIATDLAAIANIAAATTPTAATRTNNTNGPWNLGTTGDQTLTLKVGGVAMTLTLTRASITANTVSPVAATAAEMIVLLNKAGAKDIGLVPSAEVGPKIKLTTIRKGTSATALSDFSGSVELLMNFTGGADAAGTGYEPLLSVV